MLDLLALWHQWSDVLLPIGGLASGWYGNVVRGRIAARQAGISEEEAETARERLSLERERELTDRLRDVSAEAQANLALVVRTQAVLVEYHAAAIGARLQVHSLELGAGVVPSQFPPLPSYPSLQVVPGPVPAVSAPS